MEWGRRCQAAERHLSRGCIGAFQSGEWAMVKWQTGIDTGVAVPLRVVPSPTGLPSKTRPLSLLQRGLAPRSKGKARAELRPARRQSRSKEIWRMKDEDLCAGVVFRCSKCSDVRAFVIRASCSNLRRVYFILKDRNFIIFFIPQILTECL